MRIRILKSYFKSSGGCTRRGRGEGRILPYISLLGGGWVDGWWVDGGWAGMYTHAPWLA